MSQRDDDTGNVFQWLWHKLRRPALPDEVDRLFYERAAEEIAAKQPVPWIWSKAFAEADGNPERTIARYIKLRVAHLREQLEAMTAQERAKQQSPPTPNPSPPPTPTTQPPDDEPSRVESIVWWLLLSIVAFTIIAAIASWLARTVPRS